MEAIHGKKFLVLLSKIKQEKFYWKYLSLINHKYGQIWVILKKPLKWCELVSFPVLGFVLFSINFLDFLFISSGKFPWFPIFNAIFCWKNSSKLLHYLYSFHWIIFWYEFGFSLSAIRFLSDNKKLSAFKSSTSSKWIAHVARWVNKVQFFSCNHLVLSK